MNEIDYEAEVKRLVEVGAISTPDRVHFTIDGAPDIMMRGLRYFIGPTAQWLPEYDKVADWLSDNQGKGLFCYGDCGRAKLASIDDVGTEGVTSIYGNKFFALPTIIDEAERKGNLLLLSSNLSLTEIERKYGVRTMDRLRGICRPVLFMGDSLRGKTTKA